METKQKPIVKFEGCEIVRDDIKALVDYFTDHQLGDFILEQALTKVKENKTKIKEYVNKLKEKD